ncbi:MAG: hypothetical protein ACREC6_05595, partial [Hyphomicrobiaceae bacterium]
MDEVDIVDRLPHELASTLSAWSTMSAVTVLDSVLFRNAFGTPRIRDIFSDRTFVARCVEVE